MTEKIIYDTITNGADSYTIKGTLYYLLFAVIAITIVLTLRNLRRKGVLTVSKSSVGTLIRTFAGKFAIPIVVIIILGSYPVYIAMKQYYFDYEHLASGDFGSVTGPVGEYRIVKVFTNPEGKLDALLGDGPDWNETDQLMVDGWRFDVGCEESGDNPVASPGNEAECFPIRLGEKVRVDYVKFPFNRYRYAPLRITAVQQ